MISALSTLFSVGGEEGGGESKERIVGLGEIITRRSGRFFASITKMKNIFVASLIDNFIRQTEWHRNSFDISGRRKEIQFTDQGRRTCPARFRSAAR